MIDGFSAGRFNGMRAHRLLPLLATVLIFGCNAPSEDKKDPSGSGKTSESGSKGKLTKLGIEDVKVGTGDAVKAGDNCSVRYTGTLLDGTEFDSNMKGDKPVFSFVAGPTGSVIKGWQDGVIGMKVGGERKLSVPSAMAYGEGAQGKIPANSDLYFTIKLESVMRAGEERTVKVKDIKVGSGGEVKAGSIVEVKFVGTLATDKTEIDRGKFTFTVGKNEVIPGIDQGVIGMKVGGERQLTIPPMAGFGPLGKEPIVPANTNVVYVVSILGVK